MPPVLSRRRFLAVSAAASVCAGRAQAARWTGQAMGAPARLEVTGLGQDEARALFRDVAREIARLERIFSLFEPSSQLVQLNRTGILTAPAAEMMELLEVCDRLYHWGNGAFDPTVQPLWQALAQGGDARAAQGLTGWQYLERGEDRIRFDSKGRALTLNGIAQGYVTDRIAEMLRGRGLRDVMVDMGEIAVLGPQERLAGIADPQGRIVARVSLADRALATSAPLGTLIGPEQGHILDPRDPAARPRRRLVSVSAPTATMADGLSTLACLLPADAIARCLSRADDARLEALA